MMIFHDKNRQFLIDTDYKVQRYFEQKQIGMNPPPIDELLKKRQEARDLVIEPESDVSDKKTSKMDNR